MSSAVYIFSDATYYRYNRPDDRVDDGYPLPIAGNWPGVAEAFPGGIDAAVNWGDGKLYLFKGDSYVRYDIASDLVDPGYPTQISTGWPELARVGFAGGIDAAVNWGNGKAYIFSGSRYVRYDIASDKVDTGFPVDIAVGWPGFAAAGFTTGITGALNWGNGKAYVFRGTQYLRYDIATDRTDPGYPQSIAAQWPGLPASPRAMVDVLDLTHEIWIDDAEVMRAPVTGPRFIAAPWRGVLHTTEGPTLDSAVGDFRRTNFWPHFTIEQPTHRIVQHLPLSIGSRALSDAAGPENAARCIQIEIVGNAADTPNWAPEQLAFIADVMRKVEAAVPIPRISGRRFLDAAGVNQTPGNRMSFAEWQLFSGWCGHQHVPGEIHWDPGAIDIDFLVSE